MTMTADRPQSSFALNPQDELNDLLQALQSHQSQPLLPHQSQLLGQAHLLHQPSPSLYLH